MERLDFPGCCTIEVIVGLGGTRTAEYTGDGRQTDEEMEVHLAHHLSRAKRGGNGIAVVTTNDQQTQANRVLRKTGWRSSRFAAKAQHPETKVKLWWKALDNLQ